MKPSKCSVMPRIWLAGDLLLLLLLRLQSTAALNCTTPATFQSGATGCPTAAAAVALLLGNNSQMTATNQLFSGNCATTPNGISQLGLITSFGTCHYLKDFMPAGAVVLSSGKAVYGSYAYNSGAAAANGGISTAPMSDPDLDTAKVIVGPLEDLFDIAKLEFDVTPQSSGNMAWRYVFGSEEYGDFTPDPQAYADIFVMEIQGPSDLVPVNVALVPGTTYPISILSVNKWSNSSYYVDNKRNITLAPVYGVYNEEFEGFTTLLTTRLYAVTAGQTYHIKLAIADGADQLVDSIVWVKGASLNFYTNASTPAAVNTTTGTGNSNPCPVHCVGDFIYGGCSAICGGGVQKGVFLVTTAAANGGVECTNANHSTTTRPCNTQQCVYSSELASVTIQVPTTQTACDLTTRDFLVQYWTSKLAGNPLVVPETVSVVVLCNDANAHRRFLLAAQQALYAVKTSFKLKSTQVGDPLQSSGSLKEEVSTVVAAVQQLITSGDLSAQLSRHTNTTLAEGGSVNVLNLPQVPCSSYGRYHAVWNNDHSAYTCEPDSSAQRWVVPVAVVVSVTGFMLLAAVALVVRRRTWQRRKGLLGDKRYGVTTGGPATIVVTGVDGFSESMQCNATYKNQAMAIHDTILDQAVTANAGHVAKQEGDSWTVVFRSLADAVALCLQVQQALQESHWPVKMLEPTILEAGLKASASAGLAASEPGEVTAELHVNQQRTTQPTGAPNTREKAGKHSPNINDGAQALLPGGSSLVGLKVRMGVARGWVPVSSDITGSAPLELAKAVSDVAAGGQILLDSSTAGEVCRWLIEVADGDQDGCNSNTPLKALRAKLQKLLSSVFNKCATGRHARVVSLQDMGQYCVASLAAATATGAESTCKSGVNSTGAVADDTNTAGCPAAPDMQLSGISIPIAARDVTVLLQSIFRGLATPTMPFAIISKDGTKTGGVDLPSSTDSVTGGCTKGLVHVSPYRAVIKGHGEMDLVCLTIDELLPNTPAQAVDDPGAQVTNAQACTNPMVILHKRPLTSKTLEEFKQAYSSPASGSPEEAANP